MTDRPDIRLDLEADPPQELIALAERLERERPVPSAGFRGDLRRRLLAGGDAQRPRRLGALIAGFACSGILLLLAGALSAAGAGPLAA
jgi:hypothetical protein